MSQLRFWRNTSIASGNGGTLTSLLGYEWDSDLDNGFRPAGLIDLSSTTRNVEHAAARQRADNRSGHGNAQPYALSRHDERSPGLWRRHRHVVVGIVEPIRAVQWPHGAGQHGRAAGHGQPVRRHGRAAADAAGQLGAAPRPPPITPRRRPSSRSPSRRHERQPGPDRDDHRHRLGRRRPCGRHRGLDRWRRNAGIRLPARRTGATRGPLRGRARMSSRRAPPTTASICSRAPPR